MPDGSQDSPFSSTQPIKLARYLLDQRFNTRGKRGLIIFQGSYWQWNATRWKPVTGTDLEDVAWKWMEDKFYWKRPPTADDPEGTPAPIVGTSHLVDNTIRALDALVRLDPQTLSPAWFGPPDTVPTPDPSKCISFRDAVYDASTGVPFARTRDWFDTVTIPCKYNPNATCPTWLKCITEWSDDDPEWGRLLQWWFGYCLMGWRRYAKWLLMYGKSRAGKGTIGDVLMSLLGRTCYMSVSMHDLADRFALDAMEPLRVLEVREVSEMDKGAGAEVAQKLKRILGEDPQTINAKNLRQQRNVVIRAAPMIQCNSIPTLSNQAQSLTVKMLILPFQKTFAGREDWNLDRKLRREIPGIAAWATQGATSLLHSDGSWPEAGGHAEAEAAYRMVNNPMDAFLEDTFVKSPSSFVTGEEVWTHWQRWCRANHVRRMVTRYRILTTLIEESTWYLTRSKDSQTRKNGLRGLAVRP